MKRNAGRLAIKAAEMLGSRMRNGIVNKTANKIRNNLAYWLLWRRVTSLVVYKLGMSGDLSLIKFLSIKFKFSTFWMKKCNAILRVYKTDCSITRVRTAYYLVPKSRARALKLTTFQLTPEIPHACTTMYGGPALLYKTFPKPAIVMKLRVATSMTGAMRGFLMCS